jgi:hypothetical protein
MVVQVRLKLNAREVTYKVKNALYTGVWDCVDDLQRTASGSAPHDKGILEQSWAKDVVWQGSRRLVGSVAYSVKEGDEDWNGFNYALRMHEDVYQLGEKSQQKPGGIGMSGKRYPVGRKYLTNPLYGETETYRRHLQKMIDQALK